PPPAAGGALEIRLEQGRGEQADDRLQNTAELRELLLRSADRIRQLAQPGRADRGAAQVHAGDPPSCGFDRLEAGLRLELLEQLGELEQGEDAGGIGAAPLPRGGEVHELELYDQVGIPEAPGPERARAMLAEIEAERARDRGRLGQGRPSLSVQDAE